jgi:HEAT repeat protein
VAALVEALKDKDAFVGSYAAHSLGRIGGDEAIASLEQYMQVAPKDSQKDAAKKAIEAIRARSKDIPPATQPG